MCEETFVHSAATVVGMSMACAARTRCAPSNLSFGFSASLILNLVTATRTTHHTSHVERRTDRAGGGSVRPTPALARQRTRRSRVGHVLQTATATGEGGGQAHRWHVS